MVLFLYGVSEKHTISRKEMTCRCYKWNIYILLPTSRTLVERGQTNNQRHHQQLHVLEQVYVTQQAKQKRSGQKIIMDTC